MMSEMHTTMAMTRKIKDRTAATTVRFLRSIGLDGKTYRAGETAKLYHDEAKRLARTATVEIVK